MVAKYPRACLTIFLKVSADTPSEPGASLKQGCEFDSCRKSIQALAKSKTTIVCSIKYEYGEVTLLEGKCMWKDAL
jgi:hypothetical protein